MAEPSSSALSKALSTARLQSRTVLPGQVDGRAEIDAGVAFKGQKSAEAHPRIGYGVDRDDHLAAAFQEGIDAEIFNMTAIRQQDLRALLGDPAEYLLEQTGRCEYRSPADTKDD